MEIIEERGFIAERLAQHNHAGIPGTVYTHAMPGVAQCHADPVMSFRHNVIQLREAMPKHGRFLFTSSAAAKNPTTHYGWQKHIGEEICLMRWQMTGEATIVLRLSNVYGPGSMRKSSCVAQMIKDALQTGIIWIDGDGSQLRDFVHVDDVCESILLAMSMPEAPSGVHTICSGRMLSVRAVANEVARHTGAKIQHRPARAVDSLPATERRAPWAPAARRFNLDDTIAYFNEELANDAVALQATQ